ncbi:MAG TPA: glycerol dehydratase reactivase beta/small subunit family protein [Dermatophilaceae bacterium]|jgi:Dehydratase medium subunit
MDTNRPALVLHRHRSVENDALRELLLGMEEEGVPVRMVPSGELNPLELAAAAALESRLGVGIGVSLDYVVVTTEKLPAGRPYIARRFNADAAQDRTVGANAARLVKRLPLFHYPTAR